MKKLHGVKGALLGFVIVFVLLTLALLFIKAPSLPIFYIALFSLTGALVGFVAATVADFLEKTTTRALPRRILLTVVSTIILTATIFYLLFFFFGASTVSVTNHITLEDDFSDYVFVGSYRDVKGTTSYYSIGNESDINNTVNQLETRGVFPFDIRCMNIFAMTKEEYGALKPEGPMQQPVVSRLCYRKSYAPYKGIKQSEHIYAISLTQNLKEPSFSDYQRTPWWHVIALSLLLASFLNIWWFKKYSK